MPRIDKVYGREILDSRGRPTVEATCVLEDGASASASVPSGASVGNAEALELRDGDPKRYRGFGCRQAVSNINEILNAALAHQDFADQAELDTFLVRTDGTPNKSKLGANAILAVSLSFARACARSQAIPLYRYFAGLLGNPIEWLPRLTVNLFSGGKHAGQQIAIQDVLMIPVRTTTMDDTLAVAFDIYQTAAGLLLERYSMRLLTADEGGLAPGCKSTGEVLALAVESIERAGYSPGRDVCLGIDVASTHFFLHGLYEIDEQKLSSSEMISRIDTWIGKYPIISVEDGLAEDDWDNWPTLCRSIAGRALTLGDDLLCTNPHRIARAIESGACDSLLLKVNQIGTLTEALNAYRLARSAGWKVVVSVRSGETEDNWAADLAVGWGADQFKAGSITQSERLAKYNRLLAIEQEARYSVRGSRP